MTKDDKFLKQARDRWKIAEDADAEQRKRELEDLRFYAGGEYQWDDDIIKSRKGMTLSSGVEVPARPALTINKTIEPVRQVLNQQRQADLGYELVPADDFGEVTGPIDHSEIELREGMVRKIQRDPEAEDARMWSFQRAAIAGRGYRVVMTRYLPGKRSDQEIYVHRIYNQNSVRIDPSHEQPDASDIEWGFYGTDMFWSAFKSEYPDAKVSKVSSDDRWRGLGDEAPGWFSSETDPEKRTLRVTDYFYTERDSKELYHLSNGGGAYDKELAETGEDTPRVLIADPRIYVLEDEETGEELCHTEITKRIKWCKITGCDVLERTDWPGQWIPIIQEVGEELLPFDGQRRKQGVVRPMRDACKGNNYIISKFVERVGLTPIPPVAMAAGQDEGYEQEWDAINTRALPRVHFNQKDLNGQQAPPPFRIDSRAEIADIATGVQIFGQAIQATSVVPETALGNTDATVKSGKLARALIEQAEMGTSNFMDNHKRSLRHEARIVNDLLYPVMGREGRMLKIVNGQGDVESIILGQPFTLEGQGRQKKPVPVQGWQQGMPLPPNAKLYKLTPDANFNVAVKISKSIDTRRQQIVQFLGELIGSDPTQMAIIGDMLWKYLDVPEHAQIEERYRLMLAPPIQQLLSGDSPLPPEAMQKIAVLEQQLAEVMPLADKNKSDIEKVKIQESEETKRTQIKQMGDDARTRADNETKLAVAELGAKVDRLSLFLEERERLGVQMHEGTESELDRQHQRELAAQEHAQALEQGQQQQQGQAEQAQLQHQQALEQQAQAAALQPEPSAE